MSSARQAVIRGPSFTGLGKRPVFTPSHQVDLLTGIGPSGASNEARRMKPTSGIEEGTVQLRLMDDGVGLGGPNRK
jgi:hypothetical protein